MATRLIPTRRTLAESESQSGVDVSPAQRPCETTGRRRKTGSTSVVLGIDPGMDRTGYAVVAMPNGAVADAGLIRSNVRAELPARLAEIAAGLDEVLSECRPDLIAVEELFSHYKHPRTAILMGHVRGVVLLAAARHGVRVLPLSATRIKRTLTGNGHAGKSQVQRAITTTLGLPRIPQPADVADALAIAWCAGILESPRPVSIDRCGSAVRKGVAR